MQLTSEAERFLETWIGPETWHTDRAADMEHFYRFVRQIWEDQRRAVDPEILKRHILAEVRETHPLFPSEQAEKVVADRVKTAQAILAEHLQAQGL